MKIYVITHKAFKDFAPRSLYVSLLVGADINKGKNFYLKDNSTADNISSKNKNYCELTGAYWIWKNVKEDIVGICHYRRYFCKTKRIFKKRTLLKKNRIRNILKYYDIILPLKGNYEYNDKTSKEFFAENHDEDVWNKCKKIISEKYYDYLTDFEWFEKETTGYCYNMMIVSKNYFDEYHDWLFKILFELEKKIDISKYNNYNVRMYGFLSERLLNVWVHHKHLRVKEMPVYNSEEPCFMKKMVKKIIER